MSRLSALIVVFFLFSAGAAFSQSSSVSADTGIAKRNPKEGRHTLGARKSFLYKVYTNKDRGGHIPLYDQSLNDYQIQYLYRFGKRWRLGLNYAYINHQYRVNSYFNYLPDDANTPSVPADLRISEFDHSVRFVFSFDILRKSYLVMRLSGYLPIYRSIRFTRGFSGEWDTLTLRNTNGAGTVFAGSTSDDDAFIVLTPELVLDFLYPFKHGEVGVSPYLNITNFGINGTRIGVYLTYNYVF